MCVSNWRKKERRWPVVRLSISNLLSTTLFHHSFLVSAVLDASEETHEKKKPKKNKRMSKEIYIATEDDKKNK